MAKRIVSFALALLTAFSAVSAAFAQVNPSDSEFGVLHLQKKGTGVNGLTEYITVDENGTPVELADGHIYMPFNESSAHLPASYDARKDGISGKVRNQGNFGTCWAIAVSSVMETYAYKHNLAPADSLDFSETHLAYFGNNSLVTDYSDPTSGDGQVSQNPWNEGGNVFKAAAALARWSGITDNSDFPRSSLTSVNTKLNEKDRYNSNSSFILESYDILDLNDRREVKEWIYENGAATLSYSHNDKFLEHSGNSYSYYANEDTQEYHAVTVIGWDDNYSKSNFAVTPPENGAWLCKNSWGKSWSDGGYYWISYYDTTIYRFSGLKIMPKSALVTLKAENEFEYQNFGNYTYNGAMYLSMLTNYEEISAANVFIAKSTERLSAVSTYTAQGNVIATVSVYKNLPENYSSPLDGTLANEPQTYLIENEGYHTLELSDFITLSAGENFAVVIDFRANGTEIALPIEYDGEDGNAENYVYRSLPRQSYVSLGYDWIDVNKEGYDNVYIQAFTDSFSPVPESGEKIILGSYPQSEVKDSELLSSLNALELNWNLYNYYCGNGLSGSMNPSNCMEYADVEFNAEKYRAVKINSYRPYYSEEISSANTSYQDENGYYINRIYWFRYEPVTWSVINRDEGIILCDLVIDSQPYSNLIYRYDANGDGSSGEDEYYNNQKCTVKLNDYESSSIRAWLNGEFYNTAFSNNEKAIIDTYLSDNAPFDSQSDYSDTEDKVFLLSHSEISDKNLPLDYVNGTTAVAQATDYAKCQGIKTFIGTSSVYWWLRSAYKKAAYNCTVSYTGRIGSPNLIWSSSTGYGVRPALKINLKHNYHSVTWNFNGKTLTETHHPGDIISIPESPSLDGYTFANWSPEIPDLMPDKDISFSAEWNANSYDIYFDANGGSWNGETSKAVSSIFSQSIVLPQSPYRQGYVFVGWADSEGNPPAVLETTKKVTYFALWAPSDKNSYTVRTYIMNTHGTYTLDSTEIITATTNAAVKISAPLKEGFTFNPDLSVMSGTVAADGSLKLSVYYDRNQYELTVNGNGSTSLYRFYYGEDLRIPVPERIGHSFTGWDKELPQTMPANNLEITANWSVNQYTITFDSNGAEKIAPLTLDYASKIKAPPEPQKNGYVFLGWSPQIPETMPAENITVTALFGIVAELSLKVPSVDTVRYGETLILHAETSVLPDHIRLKWSSDNSCVTLTPSADGKTCALTPASNGSAVITVSLVDEKGNEIIGIDSELKTASVRIASKTGFFWKIISFFKNLFGAERVIDK